MKRVLIAAGMLVLSIVAYAQSGKIQTFRGEVSDTQCAFNVHSLTRSHAEMLKSKSMGGSPRSCSQYCIEHLGGELALAMGESVYRLDNRAAQDFLGQKVKVTGTVDLKTKTIHVLKVEPELLR